MKSKWLLKLFFFYFQTKFTKIPENEFEKNKSELGKFSFLFSKTISNYSFILKDKHSENTMKQTKK